MPKDSVDSDIYSLMFDLGQKDVQEMLREKRAAGRLIETGPGARLAAEAAGAVHEYCRTWLKGSDGVKNRRKSKPMRIRQMLGELGSLRAAAAATRTVINTLGASTEEVPTSKLRRTLGEALKQEMILQHIAEEDPTFWSHHVQRRYQGLSDKRQAIKSAIKRSKDMPEWDGGDCSAVGMFFIDAFKHCTDLLHFYTLAGSRSEHDFRKGFSEFVRLSSEVETWLQTAAGAMVMATVKPLPITEPPLDWGPDEPGGYHEFMPRCTDIIRASTRQQRESLPTSGADEVYRAINTAQRTPWRINSRVWEIYCLALKHEWPDTGLLTPEPVFPTKPTHEFVKGDEGWATYGRLKHRFFRHSQERKGQTRRHAVSRALVEHYLEKDSLYFPHFFDFRGRLYPFGAWFNYQGTDHIRGSLEFAHGKPLSTAGSVDWFKIHGANCWGEDKCSMADRISWVHENSAKIVDCGENPIDNRWWTEADKPFCFLAWCFEYSDWYKDSRNFVSHLPIAMDGSNNGLQIFSLLTRDERGGRSTNCAPTSEPQDIYSDVADKVTAELRSIASSHAESAKELKHRRWAKGILRMCDRFYDGKIPRKATKRPVMTLPYGSTRFSCQHYMTDWYHDTVRDLNLSADEAPFAPKESYKAMTWIGNLVWDAVGDTVVKARECMDWLRDASDLLAAYGKQTEWSTPTGFHCIQQYITGVRKRVMMKSAGSGNMTVRVWEPDKRVDSRKARNGFSPNYVHSLDSAAMVRTINLASMAGVTHFAMIHDSFACHAHDAPLLARSLREAYVEVFEVDLLKTLRDELQSCLPEDVQLPKLPEYGSLDVEQLNNSTYFFA